MAQSKDYKAPEQGYLSAALSLAYFNEENLLRSPNHRGFFYV